MNDAFIYRQRELIDDGNVIVIKIDYTVKQRQNGKR
jgi:hypothetical protein